ncbi:MAG: peptidase [Magnetovibrio sp.]|nr:peptidase [Magnetovibrio sp.]
MRLTFRNYILPLVLASCVWTTACEAPLPPLSHSTKQYPLEAVNVIAAAYGGITEKYVEPVNIERIALEGIKGLTVLDPALLSLKDGKLVRLKFSGNEIAVLPYPRSATAFSWARFTVDLVNTARIHSRKIQNANLEKIFEAIFDSALSELDSFSRYAGANEARRNRARRDGFGGIGIRFSIKSGKVIIASIIPGTPAATSRLKTGDQITHINTKLVGKKSTDLLSQLRGLIGSKITLTIFRPREKRSFDETLLRAHIVPPSVTEKLEDKILYLRISNFNQGTVNAVRKQIEAGKKKSTGSLRGIIIDLRGNRGGLLKQSIKLADLFLTRGQILTTRGRHPDSLHQYVAGGRDLANGAPVVVIIDGKSASASEIVAAALQDHKRAVIIGTSSFGKGSVQTVIRLPNEGEITLTWSRFITPSGYTLHGLGVRPTICTIEINSDFIAIIEQVLNEYIETRNTLTSPHTETIQQSNLRKALHKICPSRQRKARSDIRIAKHLIQNEALFQRAINLSESISAAGN